MKEIWWDKIKGGCHNSIKERIIYAMDRNRYSLYFTREYVFLGIAVQQNKVFSERLSPVYPNEEGRWLNRGFFFTAGRISQSTMHSVLMRGFLHTSEGGVQGKYHPTSPWIVLGTIFWLTHFRYTLWNWAWKVQTVREHSKPVPWEKCLD